MKEVQEYGTFHPTKEELIVLMKYWAERALEIESHCGSVIAEHSFARAQLKKGADSLGEDLLREIIREEQARRAGHRMHGEPPF